MAFSTPVSILEKFGLHEGQHVADLGIGSGFYTLAAAKMVGQSGKVYALEVQNEVLERVVNEARRQQLRNISFIHADIERPGGTKIANNTLDAALVANVLFQIEQKPAFLSELKRIVKPGGRLLVVDWTSSFGNMGPQVDHVVTEAKARELFKNAGFTEVATIAAGDHHWGLVFRK